jgi:O-methyltransferase
VKYVAQKVLNRFGYSISRVYDQSVTDDLRELIEHAGPHTTTGVDALAALYDAVRYVVRARIPGAFVECGVWKGGSLLAVARTLAALGETERELVGFDTFAGMPPPTDRDRRFDGQRAAERPNMNLDGTPSVDDVRALLAGSGYPADRIRLVPGRVEETIPVEAPERIALLRLDTDWYESTRHELEHLYPRLSSGGVLIVDDYGHWQGAREATEEFLDALERPLYLHRVDYTVRLAVKP